MKLCRDCKHCHELAAGAAVWFCWHRKVARHSVNYVNGGQHSIPVQCQQARRTGACGPDGKLWEPTDEAAK
jgi:hypothetical protein